MRSAISERKPLLEVITGLEEGTINPRELSKGTKKECIRFLRLKGYSVMEISSILYMSSRSVFRYLEKVRKENALTTSTEFQRELVGEVLNNFRAEYARLIRLSHSANLDDSGKVRAIYAASKVQKEMVNILDRLGYLGKEFLEEKSNGPDNESELFAPDDPVLSRVDKLLPSQRGEIIDLLKADPQCDMRKIAVMIQCYIADNRKKGLYDPDGTLRGSLGLSNVIPPQSNNLQPFVDEGVTIN
ncbi:MAG: hypothetical protein ABSE81_05395 [Candidatus Omnitrophota bacterium]|jgi:DNA-binding CsgD family transcriptional regulator